MNSTDVGNIFVQESDNKQSLLQVTELPNIGLSHLSHFNLTASAMLFSFSSDGDQTQGLTLAKQASFHLAF
jgi:hypothetical protein